MRPRSVRTPKAVVGLIWLTSGIGLKVPGSRFSSGDYEAENPRNDPLLAQPHSPAQACSRSWALPGGWKEPNLHGLHGGITLESGAAALISGTVPAHPHTLFIITHSRGAGSAT